MTLAENLEQLRVRELSKSYRVIFDDEFIEKIRGFANWYKSQKGTMRQKVADMCYALDIRLFIDPKLPYLGSTNCKDYVQLKNLTDRFDLYVFFHEFGHYIMHDAQTFRTTEGNARAEAEADRFAEMMMTFIYGEKIKPYLRAMAL